MAAQESSGAFLDISLASSSSDNETLQIPRRCAQATPSNLDEALACVRNAKRIVCIVGAGISTNSGIPDFRSPDSGLYAQIKAGAFGEVPVSEPQELYVFKYKSVCEISLQCCAFVCSFDINVFRDEPELFYSVAGSFMKQFADAAPSPAHVFLAGLANAGVLLRVYTQNIDGLEQKSGVPADKVVQCHGSLNYAKCASCNARASIEVVRAAAASGKVPRCLKCKRGAIKPSVVFFHEALPKRFHSCLKIDIQKADLVLVMGSSMRVAPVSKMLGQFPLSAPAILVNRDKVTGHQDQQGRCTDEFDVELLGDADFM
jgi:NAD-dependent SIR2 family protein deacetylase